MTAIREFRTTRVRLYRISKEMCPHHPKPSAVFRLITHDYFNFISILQSSHSHAFRRHCIHSPSDSSRPRSSRSACMSYSDMTREDYRWVTLLATGSNAERAIIFADRSTQEQTAVFTSIAEQSSSKPVRRPTPEAGAGRRRRIRVRRSARSGATACGQPYSCAARPSGRHAPSRAGPR